MDDQELDLALDLDLEKPLENKLVYPHIEIDVARGGVEIAFVPAEGERKVINASAANHLTETMLAARTLLKALTPESLSYADEKDVEFEIEPEESLSFGNLLAQLELKANNPDIPGFDQIGAGEIKDTLMANWHADLLLAFERNILNQIMVAALEAAIISGNVENFVLVPGEYTKFIPWLLTDIESLGYELQTKLAS
jgi:hypothetical protein